MGKLADLIAWTTRLANRQLTSDQASMFDPLSLSPVVVAGSVDAGSVAHSGAVGIGTKTIADTDSNTGQFDDLRMSHNRALQVKDSRWWDWVPEGRTIFEDRFSNTISWVASGTGTTAYSTVRPFPGSVNCMRLTTGAVATNQQKALLNLFRLADNQGRVNGPKIWFAMLWKNVDANLGLIQLQVDTFDASDQMRAIMQVNVPTGQVSILDSTGAQTNIDASFTNSTAVPITTNETWHWMGMELMYRAGGALLQYVRLRFDDIQMDPSPYANARRIGGSSNSEVDLAITVQNNGAVAEVCDIGYVVVKDLTNVRSILG